jgi:hypothetical protein
MSKTELLPPLIWARTPIGCRPAKTRTTDETNAPEKTRLRWPAPVQEMAMEFRYTQPPHTHNFLAGLNGILHVLEHVRGVDKIEGPLGKG